MAAREARRTRCAVSTRKSSEEGLEQDFNSLDAQREACESFVKSQSGEGWQLVQARYDDGGYSGGSLKRPALEKLLTDIERQKVDTIVVCKVDRLTRSLADFAKIVDVLDAHDVSFVSVTRQFNTTTSMGRLTLNMLLSIAQFEREVTGERIRDKIAASKRKGLWMGGHVPLGYEPDGRTLRVVESEAETVRTLFRLYLELGSVSRVKEQADRRGFRSKVRKGSDQRMRGGGLLSRGHIYRLLSSPIYAEYVPHKDERYAGRHPAIVDSETWEEVQRRLAEWAPPGGRKGRSAWQEPLVGKVFDESGLALTLSHTVKGSHRYRYYVSRCRSAGDRGWRLPAQEIGRVVEDAVAALFARESELARVARRAGVAADRVDRLLHEVARWNGKSLGLVSRVDLGRDQITVHIDLCSLHGVDGVVLQHVVGIRLRRRGVETKLVLAGGEQSASAARVDPALAKAILRARDWFERLATGRARSFAQIAHDEGVTGRYVAHVLPLAFLAPDIVSSILAGRQPVDLTANRLIKQIDLPPGWAEQRALLGFEDPS